MELGDDIAYGVHDIEDIVARHLVDKDEIINAIETAFDEVGGSIECHGDIINADQVNRGLFGDSYMRKQTIARLVNLFITTVRLESAEGFSHPMLVYRACLAPKNAKFLSDLKKLSLRLVIQDAHIQQLEQRGQRVVERVFEAMRADPEKLIPRNSWADTDETASIVEDRGYG